MKAPPWRHKPKNQATRAHGRGHERERLSGLPKPPRMAPETIRYEYGDDLDGGVAPQSPVVRCR